MLYCWSPIATFEAKRIQTQQDMDDWIASLTHEDHLHGENFTFSDLRGDVDLLENRVTLRVHVHSPVDGDWETTHQAEVGWWFVANKVEWGVYGANIFVEDDANFTRRFQQYTQPAE